MSKKPLAEVKDEIQWDRGMVTLSTKLQPLIDEVDAGFKKKGFHVHYVSEMAMYGERDFLFDKPLQKTGAIECVFFEYPDHITVGYKVRPSWGLSFLTILWMVNTIIGFALGGSLNFFLLLLLGLVVLLYQKVSTVLYLKKTVVQMLLQFKNQQT